ncbi:hypothetical protein GGX14DRAFT_608345 [Mycena pura]|uniref:Uncharacterized protein n=1 Tax=Mycena pura TaxID=153505 RepID=A0AAD6YDJ4_9AGAR|nr:hypothetical protein GGX14DRAFT_608345 [Mycena pura]
MTDEGYGNNACLSEHGTNAETITCVKIKVVCFDGNESALSSFPHLPPLVPRGLPDASTQPTGYQLKCYQAFAPAPVAVRPPQFFPHIVTSSDSDAAGSPFRTSQVSATPPAPSLALCSLPARSAPFARCPCVLHAALVFCTPPVCSARRPCVLHGACALCMLPAVCTSACSPMCACRPALCISVTLPTWSPGVCPLHTVPGRRTSFLPLLDVAPAPCTAPSVCTVSVTSPRGPPAFWPPHVPSKRCPRAAYLYDITINTASKSAPTSMTTSVFRTPRAGARPPPVRPPARA